VAVTHQSQQTSIKPPHRTSRKVTVPATSQQNADSFICVCTGGNDSNRMNVPRDHTGSSVIAVFQDTKRPIPFMFLWKRTFQRCSIRIYSEHSLRDFVFPITRQIKKNMEYINWSLFKLKFNMFVQRRTKYVFFIKTENMF
jgi:hypothetical protein